MPKKGQNFSLPVATSHKFMVLSLEPETLCFPSGLNVTEETEAE